MSYKCFVLEDQDGNRRTIISGTPHKRSLGERLVAIDLKCNGELSYVEPEEAIPPETVAKNPNFKAPPTQKEIELGLVIQQEATQLQQELDTALEGKFGDFIKVMARPIASMMGMTNCSSCEARRISANAWKQMKRKYGFIEATFKLKRLWALSREPLIAVEGKTIKQAEQERANKVLTTLKGYIE